MAVRAHCVFVESRRSHWAETEVKLRYCGVAFVTLSGHLLMAQQVAVGAAMGVVAGTTTFHARCGVLENEWALFVGMTRRARGLIEAAQAAVSFCAMWIMARCAGHGPFAEAMALA